MLNFSVRFGLLLDEQSFKANKVEWFHRGETSMERSDSHAFEARDKAEAFRIAAHLARVFRRPMFVCADETEGSRGIGNVAFDGTRITDHRPNLSHPDFWHPDLREKLAEATNK